MHTHGRAARRMCDEARARRASYSGRGAPVSRAGACRSPCWPRAARRHSAQCTGDAGGGGRARPPRRTSAHWPGPEPSQTRTNLRNSSQQASGSARLWSANFAMRPPELRILLRANSKQQRHLRTIQNSRLNLSRNTHNLQCLLVVTQRY